MISGRRYLERGGRVGDVRPDPSTQPLPELPSGKCGNSSYYIYNMLGFCALSLSFCSAYSPPIRRPPTASWVITISGRVNEGSFSRARLPRRSTWWTATSPTSRDRAGSHQVERDFSAENCPAHRRQNFQPRRAPGNGSANVRRSFRSWPDLSICTSS